jgi:hypothetical protein
MPSALLRFENLQARVAELRRIAPQSVIISGGVELVYLEVGICAIADGRCTLGDRVHREVLWCFILQMRAKVWSCDLNWKTTSSALL